MEAWTQYVHVSVMLEDSTVEKLIAMIEFEIEKLDGLIEHGIEEKFKYMMIGKINGMLAVLRVLSS